MQIIKKIKRLSADYREHEKEMAEINLQNNIETWKGMLSMYQSAMQTYIMANTQKANSQFTPGGIVPEKKAGEQVEICRESKIDSFDFKDGKINIQVKSNAKN